MPENAVPGEVSIALRTLTRRLIGARNPAKLRSFVRSTFFEIKQASGEGADMMLDIRQLLRQIGQDLSVSDAPAIWTQWTRFGGLSRPAAHHPASVGDLRALPPETIPDRTQRLRVDLALGVLYPDKSLDHLSHDVDGILTQHDLGGVVASIIADARRGVIRSDRAAGLPPGFDRILAWVLAARDIRLTPVRRDECLQVALSLAQQSPSDDDKARLLQWLATVHGGLDDLALLRTMDLLESVQSDLPMANALDTCVRMLTSPPYRGRHLDEIAARLTRAARSCVRSGARCRALSAAAESTVAIGQAPTALTLLGEAAHTLSLMPAGFDRTAAVASWLRTVATLVSDTRDAGPAMRPLIDRLVTADPRPELMMALAGVQLAEGDINVARATVATAARSAIGAGSTRVLVQAIVELTGILAKPTSSDLDETLDAAFGELIKTVADRRWRINLFALRSVAAPRYRLNLVREITEVADPVDRAETILKLAEAPYAASEQVVAAVLPDALADLVRRSQWPAVSILARTALLAGRFDVLTAAVDVVDAQSVRAIASALAPVDEASLIRWADPEPAPSSMPPQTWLLGRGGRDPEKVPMEAGWLFGPTPGDAAHDPSAVEGLALLLDNIGVAGLEPTALTAAWRDAEPQLSPEGTMHYWSGWTRIHVALGDEDQAIRACHRLLETFRRHPRTALDVQSTALAGMPDFLIRYWLDQVTHELLNVRGRDPIRATMNVVCSCHLACLLPPGELEETAVPPLFLGTANAPGGACQTLAWSWFALVGQRHQLELTMDGQQDTVVNHAVLHCGVTGRQPGTDVPDQSRLLAEAAINFFRCGIADSATSLLASAIAAVAPHSDRNNTAFYLAEAWAACHRHRANDAMDLRPGLEQKLDAVDLAQEALLLADARVGRRPWSLVAPRLGPVALERIVRGYRRAGQLPMPDELAAVLEAALPYPAIADHICATVLAYDKDADRADIYRRLKPLGDRANWRNEVS
ncbi:hypothetical protein [Dactylosporangium darangshiense]|uniref:hypothetical protein n=1 Tax=Dactylosporangium darangshiense TaxID=579108 RepID=UPI0031EBF1AC